MNNVFKYETADTIWLHLKCVYDYDLILSTQPKKTIDKWSVLYEMEIIHIINSGKK